MNASHFMHYNPLKTANIFQSTSVHCLFAKKWVVTQGKLSRMLEWKQTISNNSWMWLDGPQQLFNWECGFYVMKFMTKYADYMYQNNALNIKVQLPLPNPQFFLL
jgi:hypothetical protein